jgi:hypothetical protein
MAHCASAGSPSIRRSFHHLDDGAPAPDFALQELEIVWTSALISKPRLFAAASNAGGYIFNSSREYFQQSHSG